MNKLTLFLNKFLEIINSCFKLTIIICIIIYLILYYQSTLNHRYQYHQKDNDIVIFDTKKGEMYLLLPGKDKEPSQWVKVSPFSKREWIPLK